MEFQPWPKIPRLNRNMVITEKIDGTNACIIISKPETMEDFKTGVETCTAEVGEHLIHCQSRKRIIQPAEIGGKGADNMGFAAWVAENCENGLLDLGPGRHYGEWWGQGIQRGYGLDHKRFSLFNVGRASYRAAIEGGVLPDNVGLVPVLHRGVFDQVEIGRAIWDLSQGGSVAAAEAGVTGTAAEGIVVFHEAARQSFKVTLEGDEKPKGQG